MENDIRTGDIIFIPHPETGNDYCLRVDYAAREILVCSDVEGTELAISRFHEGLTLVMGSAARANFL